MIKYSEGDFKSEKYQHIFHQSWVPETNVKAVIILAHGLGEHSGRYEPVVTYLNALGYAVYSWDHPGHGRSGGERKYIKEFTDFTDVMGEHYDLVKAEQPDLPIYLIGHSMGGLITANYLLDHQEDFAGVIFSAPAIDVAGGLNPFVHMGGRLLSALIPRLGFQSFKGNLVCRDPELMEVSAKDPLSNYGKTTIRLLAELVDAMVRVKSEGGSLTLPILMLQGTDDVIVDPKGAERLYELAASEDKTLKLYEGFYHELFNDPEKERVFADVRDWLEKRVGH
ncbi:alpha/beta hydrolase [Leucothrix sargassi]|nr:alpha/beta hydrolase [Leucothrix sargassi]